MDRNWMNESRISEEYENGVEQLLQYAKQNRPEPDGKYFCPCMKCLNGRRHEENKIREHLICDGIDRNYTKWIWHGELVNILEEINEPNVEDLDDRVDEMIRDVGIENFHRSHMYADLKSDNETPLYPGCKNFTRLSAVLKLVNPNANNGWSDKSFTELLELLKEMLPEANTLPNRNYEAKKILCPMGMAYKKIHACPNDCILYRKEYELLHKCPKCSISRYKAKYEDCSSNNNKKVGPPAKVLWYLPIIPRFKRLFANGVDAINLTWHADGRKRDGQLRHPADSSQWKKIDRLYPHFGSEPRNLRLALATDGMNPYGNLSTNHSSWPVLLVIYNLPHWLCMKRKYVLLSMMISGPKQLGNDIDVYLSPLIEDLRLMWEEGIEVFDGYRQKSFNLRAILFCTINDFPAYGNLSGYSVKGHHACPVCEENTSFVQLKHGRKTVYTQYRRFLRRNHPYRRLKKAFNGSQEEGVAPTPLTGYEVYDRVKNIQTIFGKTQKKSTEKKIWKKRSIFFDLPYWCDLDVRHCIDVMHVEKNVCDSVIGTLLNIKGKTKDSVTARQDLLEMRIRPELHPQSIGKRTYLPPACHTLSKKEKESLCRCLHGVKVPQGYSSNIKSLVSLQNLKLVGLKSHDCHVLIQQLLPVAIRGVLPKKVRHVITRLCYFFHLVCNHVIDPLKLDEWQNEVAVVLCQLEMYFPPSFFDIMVHLIIHLVNEIRVCGPVFLRWMYPVERYMKILKGYTKNPARPEASIVERYIAEESIEFCTDYMSQVEAIGLPKLRHDERKGGKGTRGIKVQTKRREEILLAHLYILNNNDEVLPFLTTHKNLVKTNHPRMNEKWLLNEHNKTFIKWFEEQISHDDSASTILKWLARGPQLDVITWRAYDINGYSYYTKSQDDTSTVQNSGVTLQAESMHFSSSKDKNPVAASINYFGVIEDIWEIDYVKFRVPIFKCKWVDYNTGVHIDELGFTLVDFNKESYKDEPFIMAHQAKQVLHNRSK